MALSVTSSPAMSCLFGLKCALAGTLTVGVPLLALQQRAAGTSHHSSTLGLLLIVVAGAPKWIAPIVYVPFTLFLVLFATFFVVELRYAREPVLPPALVYMKVPMLVGTASFMVSMCNFAVMYNLPTWFQTVMLTSAGEAGERTIHITPRRPLLRPELGRCSPHPERNLLVHGIDLCRVSRRRLRGCCLADVTIAG